MAAKRGSASKHDVEMRQLDLDIARMGRRYELGSLVARYSLTAVCIAALALPVYAFVEPIAGKTTTFSANVALSVTLALSGLVHLLRETKQYSRRNELKRQREMIKTLAQKAGVPDPLEERSGGS